MTIDCKDNEVWLLWEAHTHVAGLSPLTTPFLLSLVLKISFIKISFNESQAHFIMAHPEILLCSEANDPIITEPRALKKWKQFPRLLFGDEGAMDLCLCPCCCWKIWHSPTCIGTLSEFRDVTQATIQPGPQSPNLSYPQISWCPFTTNPCYLLVSWQILTFAVVFCLPREKLAQNFAPLESHDHGLVSLPSLPSMSSGPSTMLTSWALAICILRVGLWPSVEQHCFVYVFMT